MAWLCAEAQGAFIFLPGVPIPLDTLLPMLISVDVLGASLNWRWLDHWGHLGGALFGIVYTQYGYVLWDRREKYLRQLGLL